ncbi:putative quinol monooxygenase [Bordetella holmesii]|uniref:Antibiotic biosynthesis monooxygenase n=2 Tax=Bordetella holmesii TaxID=35814 RepID=A0A158M809_9BORD|nr:putative quinol monooxygenase [Bordetella holmesii]AHV92728.1 antibiotic biosynthesis monooxygenase family protein [Bordetella holmesii ATCC 51541]AIT26188.1 antibiotic biosynthesis monooxygenase family protein [Bordetella holmesii 44057]EWM43875.1 antibiotic biosynthesis monooxygenase family protein [Bordetella holmesii 41130]EWM46760.1 antibiotic biosynthesis monooxygenase family protein [Bordetella holmesii 35009]EWM50927.1 antibiotic biosynthesis monooxygenase family protein [Bordetella
MALHVIASFAARPESFKQVRELLISLIEPIRQDPGCIQCDLVTSADRPLELLFVEQWRGAPELERHLADPGIASVVQQAAPMLARPFSLERFTPVG